MNISQFDDTFKVKFTAGLLQEMKTPFQYMLFAAVNTPIDLSHKSQNASVPYPTMQHFITEMCTCVHISVIKWCMVGYLSDAFWDL